VSGAHYMVPGLKRGLDIVRLFDRAQPVWTAPEIARALGIPRATVHRLLQTLEGMRFLDRAPGAHAFRLGPAVLGLGFEFLRSLDITEHARPVLQRLMERTGFAAHLAIRDGREIVHIARHARPGVVSATVGIGARLPAHATSIGRVFLADLPAEELHALYRGVALHRYLDDTPADLPALEALLAKDRERGIVIGRSLFERGLIAVSAPVRDAAGCTAAGINVIAVEATADWPRAERPTIDAVRAAAAEISALLGHRPAAPGRSIKPAAAE